MCLQKFPPQFADFPKSATGQLPTCAYKNSATSLQIFLNLPLDSYLHVLAEISPQGCRFSKICHWTVRYLHVLHLYQTLPLCDCRNSPPSLQIFQNLPLDSYLSYLYVLAEIPPSLQIFQNSATGQIPTYACRNSPWGADFPKSATGQLPKLPTCACRNSPPFADFPKSATGHIVTYMCLQKSPPVWRFSKICHWTVTYMCLQKFPPQFADFPKSATGQLPKLPTCACRNYPPVCRFSKICHWTVTYLHVLAEIHPSLQIF